MLKKILCLALSVCMILTMFTCITATADATPDIVATVTTSEEGDGSFKITFASTSSSVESFQVIVPYDKNKYTLLVGANPIATNKIIFNQNIEGSILFSDNDEGAGVSWYTTNGMMLDKNTGETLSANTEGLYEIAYLTFNLNKDNLLDEDYSNKLKLEFNAYSFAAPTDKEPTVTYVEFNIPDTRTEIDDLTATPVEGLKYKGEAYAAEDLVTINTKKDDVVSYSVIPAEIKNADEYTVTATVRRAGYKPTVLDPVKVVIGKADTEITIADAEITYGQTDFTKDFIVSDGVDKSQITVSGYSVPDYNAGNKNITATATSTNYEVKVNAGTLKINQKPITAKVDDATKVYGDADPTFKAQANGLINGDTLTYKFSRDTGNDVGIYKINATASNDNYIVTVTPGNLEITPKEVTVTVDAATKVYGESNPAEYTAKVEGLVGNDKLAYTVARADGEDVGTYAITATIGENKNYKVVKNTAAIFTITQKPVTVTVNPVTKMYGEKDPEFTSTNTEIKDGDDLGVTYKRAEGENAGTYEITPAIANANYVLTAQAANLTITKKPVTVTVNPATKVYGEKDPEFTSTNTEIKDGDDLGVTYKRAEGENAGTYKITPLVANTNYELTPVTADLTITKKPVTLTIKTAEKVYGQADPTFEATPAGLVGQDTLNYTLSRENKSENAGTYVITAVLGENKNYDVKVEPAKLTINPLAVKMLVKDVKQPKLLGKMLEPEISWEPKLIVGDEIEVTTTVKDGEGNKVEDFSAVGTYKVAATVVGTYNNYTIEKNEVEASYEIIETIPVYIKLTGNSKEYDGVAVKDTDVNFEIVETDKYSKDNVKITVVNPDKNAGNYEIKYELVEGGEVTKLTHSVMLSTDSDKAEYVINPKKVTLTIKATEKVYGQIDPTFEATPADLVGQDTLNYTLSRENKSEDVGDYKVTAELGENPNYEVKVVDGTFTINKKDIEVKVAKDALNMTYGDKVPVVETDAPEGVYINFTTIEDPTVGEHEVKVDSIESKNYNVTNKDSIVCKLIVAAKEIEITSVDIQTKKVTFAESAIINGDAVTLDFGQLDVVVDISNSTATVKNFVLKDEADKARAANYVVITESLPVYVTISDAKAPEEGTVQEGVEATVKTIEGAKAIILETLTVDSSEDEPISLDATKVDPLVETIAISNNIVKELKDKAELALTLSEAVINFDKSALSAIADKITEEIVLKVSEYNESLLSETQVEAMKNLDNVKVFSFNINNGGFDFGEGKVTVTVDFENTNNKTVRAKYLKDDGTTEDVKVSYVDGKAKLEISHFSEYAIYTVRATGGRPSVPGTVIKPATGVVGGGSTTKPEEDTKAPSASIAMKEDAKDVNFAVADAENKFNPDVNASRNDVVAAISAIFDVTDVKNAPSFTDTEDEAIKALAAAGVIDGYEDGSFQGEKDITRAEFVKLLAAALKLEAVEGAEANFLDIDGHWAEEWVKTFVAKGYLVGYPDGTFRPEAKITRAEMVVVITRVTGAVAGEGAAEFADVDASHWAYDYIMKAAK